MKQEKLGDKNQIKKEKEVAISRRNVQRLSKEIVELKEIVRKVVKTLRDEKRIDIKLTKKEKEILVYD